MLTITLLGTAATMPLPDRALSAAFAACGGHGPSGTSPTHFLPSHMMTAFLGLRGLPLRSTEARLYRMRRLTGQHHDQFGYRPMLACMGVWLGSRRLDLLPSSSV